jgi:hypothetical protein
MRLLLMVLLLLSTGCAKHPVGAWQPAPPAIADTIVPPPPEASVPRMTFPHRTLDASGKPAEPITMIVAAHEETLVNAFSQAGWVHAEAITPESSERLRIAHAWSDAYPNAPVSPLTYWGREQDAAWQRPGATAQSRIRVRVWRSEEQDASGRWLWALNVGQESGFTHVPQEGMPVYHLLPDLDAARDALARDLTKTGQVKSQYLLEGIGDKVGFRTASGETCWTAGWVRVLEL